MRVKEILDTVHGHISVPRNFILDVFHLGSKIVASILRR